MYTYNLGYRWKNNEIEGFVGVGTTKDAAWQNAIRRIRDKATLLDEPFVFGKIIERPYLCSTEEMKKLRADWELEKKL